MSIHSVNNGPTSNITQNSVKKTGQQFAAGQASQAASHYQQTTEASVSHQRKEVEISDKGMMLSQLEQKAKDLPDSFSKEKVAKLKAEIESGRYTPDVKAIAKKLFDLDQNFLD